MANKHQRLELLKKLIRTGRMGTQEQLQEHLRKQGYRVTQPTLSRDLEELGVQKNGGLYRLQKSTPLDMSIRDYANVVQEITPCGPHMIVIKTAAGQAQPIALALDHAPDGGLLATLAGDDVIFVATRSRRTQEVALRRLRQWFGEKRTGEPERES
ncbi:MAG: Arginine repressor [Phycisphaerae bacterium]|nr:Arginine repressor [Phycisphaerae bacterium]